MAARGGVGARDRALPEALALLALLVVAVAVRFVAMQRGIADPFVLGAAFGLGLIAIALVGRRHAMPGGSGLVRGPMARADIARAIALGLAGGLLLVVIAVVGRQVTGSAPIPRPFADAWLWSWASATVLVATGEEVVLRGALFDRLLLAVGTWPAVLVTSLVFALMHVPFYGWYVVPLDLGVGLCLAGLRLISRGIVAPSIAHAVADLATWLL